MEPVYRYRATCKAVTDGDTYVLEVDLGFRVSIQISGRLRGVDTKEITHHPPHPTDVGYGGWQFATALMRPGDLDGSVQVPVTPLIVESHKDQMSFARWIVDIFLPGGNSLADVMMSRPELLK
jgi:micrococcal nuclease